MSGEPPSIGQSDEPHRRVSPLTALLLVAIIVAIGAVAFWPRDATSPENDATATGHTDHATSSSVPALPSATPPQPTPPPSGAPLGEPLTPPTETGVGSAHEPSLTDVASAPHEDAERDGASALGPPRAAIDPDAVTTTPGSLGGCLAAYGETGQCLPAVPPSLAEHAKGMIDAGLDPATMTHSWTCAELRLYFPDGIAVRVADNDPQQLDRDGDSIACGSAD